MTKNIKDKNKPLVSILFASLNNEIWINQCLTSLMEQTYSNIEVIFVDNNSKDRSVEFAKQQKFKSLNINFASHDHNTGFSVANNTAYDLATGGIIYLLNLDTHISKTTIEDGVKYLIDNPNVGVVQNKIVVLEEPEKIDSIGSLFTFTGFLSHLGHTEKEPELDEYPILSAKGASMFINAKVLKETYLFNPDFHSYFEDTDLCWRTWMLGYKVMYTEKIAKTYHHGGGTASLLGNSYTDFHSFKNRIFTIATHLSFLNLLFVLPLHLAICIAIAVVFLIIGKPDNSKSLFKAIYWNIKHIPKTVKLRKEVQALRRTPDKEIFAQTKGKFDLLTYIKSFPNYVQR